MRIKTIELQHFKAFQGKYVLPVACKNLFIYGENGSGKSSLYFALKDFFQSSIEDINILNLENTFIKKKNKGKVSVKVVFEAEDGKIIPYLWTASQNDTRSTTDTCILDGNRLKSFLSYKHLLSIHHIKKNDTINLFDLLINGVLKHFRYTLTENRELGELWHDVTTTVAKPTGRQYPSNRKRTDLNRVIKTFNLAFGELFKPDSPENILKYAKPLLAYFDHNIEIELQFPQIRPATDDNGLENMKVLLNLKYNGLEVEKPHLFLNEARLSAIAISIYLGLIKRHVQGIPCKVLFLDDLFIGLDICNRMPLLSILDTEFKDYQIFITTYDKPWYEYAKSFLEGKGHWKTMELYVQRSSDGTDIPYIVDNSDLIKKAEKHFNNCDYKAAAVYARSAFEKMIRNYCEKKRKAVRFKPKLKDYNTNDFWDVIKGDLSTVNQTDIETYRQLVLNPFSHYNTERHEIKTELKNAIQALKDLDVELKKQ